MPQIKLLVEGGAMQPGPTLSQQVGPLGINVGQLISKVNEATSKFKGMKVPVELDIDARTKDIRVNVFSPPVSELLKKELGLAKGSGEQKKKCSANASIEQIISVTKTKMPYMLSKNLKSAVKTVVGTCVSLGVLIEGVPASEVGLMIDEGKFKKEIEQEKTETSPEKKQELNSQFDEIVKAQEIVIKAEEAAKEVAKAAKEATAVTTTPATTEGDKTTEVKKEEAKPSESKPVLKKEKK